MLSIGVPYEVCGTLSPRKLKPFLLAHEISEKNKDYDMWAQGAYFYAALETIVANIFKKKGVEQEEYLYAPFHVIKHDKDIESGAVEMTPEERAERIRKAFDDINEEFEKAALSRRTN